MVTSVAHSKARIGVIANEQTNCNSCDSRTGLVLEDFLMTLTPEETLLKIDYVQLTGIRELRPWDTT